MEKKDVINALTVPDSCHSSATSRSLEMLAHLQKRHSPRFAGIMVRGTVTFPPGQCTTASELLINEVTRFETLNLGELSSLPSVT